MVFVWASFHGRMAPAGNKIAGLRLESIRGYGAIVLVLADQYVSHYG